MKIKISIFLFFLCLSLTNIYAQNWDVITGSGDYIYGVGRGETETEADRLALADLVSKIALHVSNDFVLVEEEKSDNDSIDSKAFVRNCINTYTQSSLTNTEKWVVGKEPDVTVRRWIKRAELDRIYADRIAKAKDMLAIAVQAEEQKRVDIALQYYYWAFSLVRSTQRPDSVEFNGHKIVNWVPLQIDAILSRINIAFDRREDNNVDLRFTYNGEPVANLDFTYSDGRSECSGAAKDGWGMLEMVPGIEKSTYHINVEYEYKGLARGDAEMKSVLDVVNKRAFPKAEIMVQARKNSTSVEPQDMVAVKPNDTVLIAAVSVVKLDTERKISPTQLVEDNAVYRDVYNKILDAIKKRKYTSVASPSYFTLNGLDVYNKLISYGAGRVVSESEPIFFKGCNERVVVRGLQMSFSFDIGKRKKTFVEDVAFTFNKEGKCDNISFGLGADAMRNILVKPTGWKEETREMILEFMENYKTAFCLKRIDYIESIFHDNATIIVGNEAKVTTVAPMNEGRVTDIGQKIIKYNRYTKNEYIEKLRRAFRAKEFVNIRFTENDIQWQENADGEVFSIQIAQDYCSSNYADKGYLFLLVDMTDHNSPQIKIRTWQPEKDPEFGLYGPGHFYNF